MLFRSGGERRLMAKVAGQINQPETGVAGDLGDDEFVGLVTAAVVDEDDRPVHIRGGGQHRFQPPEKLRQHGLFIEDRDHDGDGGCGMQAGSSTEILVPWGGHCPVGRVPGDDRALHRVIDVKGAFLRQVVRDDAG